MASEISGLDPLHGYLKHGNRVVRLRLPYIELPNRQERFVERRADVPAPRIPLTNVKPKQEPEPESAKAAASEQGLFFE
jgi:hypothetical protein